MIRRLLIANRGEIAIRIARTAHDLGIAALGIYSDADDDAYHLEFMDDARRIGPGPATESYLNIDAVIAAAREMQADAVHPGYGFLSERAAFARAVVEAGMIFVGPSADAIDAMGSKIEAKRRVRAFDVPAVPGYDGDDQSPERLRAEAQTIGTPLLIKASAGGGGRGMRVVDDLAMFDEALAGAKREALSAFGDDRVLLERYITQPRHIEVQILADAQGTTLHVGERECSIQRRHQKIIEESPSPALDDALRAQIGAAAVNAARSVGYVNAGTVEFVLDPQGRFYFLEMNTRLQVEHPVTELVYGLDLVAEQLRIADGEPLTIAQDDIVPHGWAIETRLYAEDPAHDFAPSSGAITTWEMPDDDEHVRIDAGYTEGSTVSVFYDAMLAKLAVHAPTRDDAVDLLIDALDDARVAGVRTNLPFLRRIARMGAFRAGATTTAFIPEHVADGSLTYGPSVDEKRAVAALLLASKENWRPAGIGIPIDVELDGVHVRAHADAVDETRYALRGDLDGELDLDARGVIGTVAEDGGVAAFAGGGPPVVWRWAPSPEPGSVHGAGSASGAVSAPMPGKIVRVAVKNGDTVDERALLIVLEAMKMEHRIEATVGGTVENVRVREGDMVTGGAPLLTIAS